MEYFVNLLMAILKALIPIIIWLRLIPEFKSPIANMVRTILIPISLIAWCYG